MAEQQGNDYLKYQEPKPPEVSWLSSIAYIVTLLITFAVVIALAYFTSRFLGYKMGSFVSDGQERILGSLPLGSNRIIYVVEVAGKVMIVGVTDHGIHMLKEIDDPDEIFAIKARAVNHRQNDQFGKIFHNQLSSLEQFSKQFPAVFDIRAKRNQDNQSEKR